MGDDGAHHADTPAEPAPATWRKQADTCLWWSRRGQVSNWMTYIVALALSVGVWLLLPWPFSIAAAGCVLAAAFWQWAQTHVTGYRISRQRIEIHSGLFSPQMDPVEFYRINDYRVRRPFIYRPFNRGNLWIFSDDTNQPRLCFRAVVDPESVEQLLRSVVEPERRRAGTRVIE